VRVFFSLVSLFESSFISPRVEDLGHMCNFIQPKEIELL